MFISFITLIFNFYSEIVSLNLVIYVSTNIF